MKKVVIGGVVTIAVAVVAVGFGFSFFVSSKIDEILTQSIEVEGVNFQSGQVVTSMGFLETRKIIRNSKLTLNESSFSLPEISISVDTSQALINIPNVEGELSDGTKLKGTGVVLSTPASTVLFTPASSSIDSFQADFEVANLVATRDELQASAKLLKGDVSKTDKSLSFNTLGVNVAQLEWNAKNLGSGGIDELSYREELALVHGKIDSKVSFSTKKFHSEEGTFESAGVQAKYRAESTDSSLSTPFIIQEIAKTSFEDVLQKYRLELINGNIEIRGVKTGDLSFSRFRYNEIVDREEGKHKAELKIEIEDINTDDLQSRLAALHTKLQVDTSTPLTTTLVLVNELSNSNYSDFARSRKPDIDFLKVQMQDGKFSRGSEKFGYSSIDADITRLLQGDLAKANVKIKLQDIDVSSREGAFHIDHASFDQKTSIPQQSFNKLYTLDEKLSEEEVIEFFFELIQQFQFTPDFSLGGVTLKVGDGGKTEIRLKDLSALVDLKLDQGNGNASVQVKTGLSQLFNLRSLGYPVGFDDLTLRLKIALNKVALGAWKEGLQESIEKKKDSPMLDTALRDTIAMQPELVIKIEGGQKNLNVLMASLSFKLDRDTPKSVRFKQFIRNPLGSGKKVFYQHGSTNLKIEIRDRKTLASMIDNSFEKSGLTESYLSKNEKFFELGENSLKLNLLIRGDEVMLNGKNSEELRKMNEMFIKN